MSETNHTNLLEPFGISLDLEAGTMQDPTRVTVRKATDMQGYYKDEKALAELVENGNPVHYEVFEVPVPEEYGHLMYCISTLQPGKVGEEYFMTKGHYHTIAGTAEIYLCLKGEGYMLMKTTSGECRSVKMTRGQMVYVPPFWAHRSVNTGNEPLVSFCVYQADAGHNYGDIEEEGFPASFQNKNGEVVLTPVN